MSATSAGTAVQDAAARAAAVRVEPPIVDVWSRTAPRYRVRAIVLLLVNYVLFTGLCNFAFWLRSGVPFAPWTPSYWDELGAALRFTGEMQVTLGTMLLRPISVQDVPMLIPIVGLTLAALISIPILTAILYRFWASVPLVAAIAFGAVMPWLALTLLLSCLLASARPFRFKLRFISALFGLLPTVIYLFLAFSGTERNIEGVLDPVEHIKLIAPWVLAVVAATLVFAVVLVIARLVNYRPGAVTPLLAVMFAAPVVLFEAYVGRDELYYRLLKDLDTHYFTEVNAAHSLEQAATVAWLQHPLPRPSYEEVMEIQRTKWQFDLTSDIGPYRSELTAHQQELADRCDWFWDRFPDSRYMLNVLYIKARALDRRVDGAAFRETRWIRFYDDYPNEDSYEAWQLIAANWPESPAAAVALLRLAQLDARKGDVDRALEKLDSCRQRFERRPDAEAMVAAIIRPESLLAPQRPDDSLNIELDRLLLEARRLQDLLTANRDPIYGYDPLCGSKLKSGPRDGMLDFDPRGEEYPLRLAELLAAYPDAQVADNIAMELALAERETAKRIALLADCVERYATGDAAPEALYRLAAAYQDELRPAESRDAYGRLLREFPESVWAEQARRAGAVPLAEALEAGGS